MNYREGNPTMSDLEYDNLIDRLKFIDPNNKLLGKIGFDISDNTRKRRLDIVMASMEKVKSMADINSWIISKSINIDEIIIITPKFDGVSLCVDEEIKSATTRGDGEFGQKSDEHYKYIQNKLEEIKSFKYTYGEVMMPKKTFLDKYASDFANPRNLVAGLLNSKTVDESLKSTLGDCNFIKYGAIWLDFYKDIFKTKQEILDTLNSGQKEKVEYHVCKISDLTEDMLIGLFHKFSTTYEIDGLVIEINDLSKHDILGRETSSNNPVWARAFKHASFEQSAETEVIGISWNISKQGYLKPILHIKPVKLDGVTVSNVTGNNARFVKDMGLGIGAIVIVKRSGMVIPIITEVVKSVPFVMPNVPNIDWNENGVELMTLTETDEQRFKQAVSFLEILEIENVGEGVVRQLWDAGFNTIKSILEVTPDKLFKLDGFGKRKASIVCNAIHSKINNVQLSKLQHATGFFKGLGSKKLLLLEQFETKPTIDQILTIEGFAETSAKSYLESYDRFFEFAKELPVTVIKKVEDVKVSTHLQGKSFVFTGVRLPEYESFITDHGGTIGSSVSKNTTHLVMKNKGSGSSKEKKAIDLGVKILEIKDLEDIIYTIKNK